MPESVARVCSDRVRSSFSLYGRGVHIVVVVVRPRDHGLVRRLHHTPRYCVKLFPGESHSRRASNENDTDTLGLDAEQSADYKNNRSTGDDDDDAASPPSLTSDFRVSTIFLQLFFLLSLNKVYAIELVPVCVRIVDICILYRILHYKTY